MKKIKLTLLLTLLLASCNPKIDPLMNNNNENQVGYPPISQQGYPSPNYSIDTDYPAPPTVVPLQQPNEIVPFKINKPVKPGDTKISGSGPANIPIKLIDISLNGQEISTTKIDKEGNFTFDVNALEKNHRLGILINSPDGISYNDLDYSNPGFQGSEPKLVPNVGYFFDTVMVE